MSEIIADLGSGENPHWNATHTVDIREDINVDYPGVDIANDKWPFPNESVYKVYLIDVIEHLPPASIGFVWRELDRVLCPGGTALIRVPHAGTWTAGTDITHYTNTTADIDKYFSKGGLANYWTKFGWNVFAYAKLIWRGKTFRVEDGKRSMFWAKMPGISGNVIIHIGKNDNR